MDELFSIMQSLPTYYGFKLDFQKVHQRAGDTKRRKDNQLQSV